MIDTNNNTWTPGLLMAQWSMPSMRCSMSYLRISSKNGDIFRANMCTNWVCLWPDIHLNAQEQGELHTNIRYHTVSFDLRDAGDPHCVADVGRCESTTALPNSRDLQGEIKKFFGRRLGLWAMTSKRCTFQGGEIALGVFKHPFVSVLRRAKLKRCRATTRMALARNESKRPWPRFRLPQLVIGSPRDLSKELDVNGKFQRSENQKSSLIILSIKKSPKVIRNIPSFLPY